MWWMYTSTHHCSTVTVFIPCLLISRTFWQTTTAAVLRASEGPIVTRRKVSESWNKQSCMRLCSSLAGRPIFHQLVAGIYSSGTLSSRTQPFETLLAPVAGGVTGGTLLIVAISGVILAVATCMCVRWRKAVLKGQ